LWCNPAGLLSALKKLQQNDKPFKKMNHATAAMCIDDPLFSCSIRRRSCSGEESTSSIWSALRTTQSGTLSRTGVPPPSALALGKHGVGLADARSSAQVDAEMTGRLDLAGGICARLRGAAHAFAGPLGADAPDLLGDFGGLPLGGSALVRVGRLDAVSES
jgi:hypothetical protein